MAKHSPRRLTAPSQPGPPHQAIEELHIQALEQLLQIMVPPLWAGDEFASPNQPYQVCLPADVPAVQVEAIAVRVEARDLLAVEFTEQNERQRFGNRRGRAGQQIGNAHPQTAFLETDEAVYVGEAAKLHADFRHRRAWLQLAKHARINLFRSFEEKRCLKTFRLQQALIVPHIF